MVFVLPNVAVSRRSAPDPIRGVAVTLLSIQRVDPRAEVHRPTLPPPRAAQVVLAGTAVDTCTEREVVRHVRGAWDRGQGGLIVTANVDILRSAQRDAAARRLVDAADLVVADGTPLRWAAQLTGTEIPERVTGAALFWTLAGAAAAEGRRVFVLGGPPGAADRAAVALRTRYPALLPVRTACPPLGFDADRAGLDALRDEVVAARPDLVLVGLGFPKQERVAQHLRAALPDAWFLGCGAAVVFAAGDVPRAPLWMQESGLEWAHRLGAEPRRLAGRYLRDDLPFCMRLVAAAALTRWRPPAVPGQVVPTSP